MINGVPLEDACHLTQRYSRMRQEAEAQVSQSLEWISSSALGSMEIVSQSLR